MLKSYCVSKGKLMINIVVIGQVWCSCLVFIWYVLLKWNSLIERIIVIIIVRINVINLFFSCGDGI